MSKRDEEQLRSALSFAQADLESWRDGDFLNAVEDLEGRPRFREPGRIKEQLVSIQKGLRGLLEQVQEVRESLATTEGAKGKDLFPYIRIPFTVNVDLRAVPPFTRLQMVYHSKDPNAQRYSVAEAVLRVADLLTRVNLDRLKVCQECKRLFLAVRRQRFDTPQCSLRDRVRRFREKGMRRAKKGAKR